KYRRRLEAVRSRGFSLSRQREDDHPRYSDLKDAMREYAAGDLTPARERAVRNVIASSSPFFETIDIEDGETYDLGAIVVPVLGPDGRVALCLRASQLPPGVSSCVVREWVDILKQAAEDIAGRLVVGNGSTYTSYLQAMPGDFMM
uniref:hypothetical protein n=1 Tax=Intrasporangium sp. TaxID=1925024 RepID=UPI00336534B3